MKRFTSEMTSMMLKICIYRVTMAIASTEKHVNTNLVLPRISRHIFQIIFYYKHNKNVVTPQSQLDAKA